MRGSVRFGIFAALVSLSAVPPVAGQSPAAAPDRVVSSRVVLFNIPAQPLSDALEAYGAVTGYQIIYDSDLARGRRSTAVIGLFKPETALRLLLQDTDLTLRHSGPANITILASAAVRPDAPGDPARIGANGTGGELVLDTLYIDVPAGMATNPNYTGYGRIVLRKLKEALTTDDTTAHRAYEVQVDIWIDEKARVRRPKILKSTGNRQLDRSIWTVIAGTMLDYPPPKGMPQPIRMTINAF